MMQEAVIVAATRTAVGKAKKGSLRYTRPDDLGAVVVKELLKRVPEVDAKEIEDLIFGCAFPEAEQGMNVGRIIALRAGLPSSVPGMTINRYCSSGLQAIAIAAERIMTGSADVIIAGGIESMSMVPMGGNKPSFNPYLIENYPEAYMSMGHTAEEVAKRYGITREEQDQFALTSHRRAWEAIQKGKFQKEITPVPVSYAYLDENGKKQRKEFLFQQDEGVRPDTNLEVLGKLRPSFRVGGTVTAGNTSQMSDGAAAVLIMSRKRAEELKIKPLALFRGFQLGGVDPEVMGIGPVVAIPKLLRKTGVKQEEIEVIELNEAFAAQSLAVIKALDLDPERVNPNGGAIALGHPLGCTGTKLTVSALYELEREQKRYALITMCIGGGMGAAGLIECVS